MKALIRVLFFTLSVLASFNITAATVNINTADAQTLTESLNGIGEKKAKAIVEYRESNGPYRSVDDLTQVKGIGDGILEKNRELITIDQ